MEDGLTPIEPVGQVTPTPAHVPEVRKPEPPETSDTPPAALTPSPASVWEGSARVEAAYAQYAVDPASGHVSIQIRDAQTNEVVRQIPSEESARAAEVIQAYLQALYARRVVAPQEG